MSTGHYILNGNNEVIEVEYEEYAIWMAEKGNKIIKQEDSNGFWVSTVFLGIDHGYGDIQIFETMIFGLEGESEYQERCATYKEALVMHDRAILYTMSKATDNMKIWEITPADEIFNSMKDAAIEIWLEYDDTYGYASEKIDRIKGITNIKDNAMTFYRMFDHINQAKMRAKLDITALNYIKENS